MKDLKLLIEKCRNSHSSFILVVLRYLFYRVLGKNILANQRAIVRGARNIYSDGLVQIGMSRCGFMHKNDWTYLNVRGKLIFKGRYSIGKGCRFDIARGAVAKIGSGYVNANSKFVIMHGIEIGDRCAISWGCEFLDEDFHELIYEGRKHKNNSIIIGDDVWVGSNVTVLKGCRIPDGCVIASGSLVASVFEKRNCLLAGNPAKVIKDNIQWK